ncbi:uncharacterized protein V1518DRAFT_415395 [Limtongia smithiae]|uniref:uncharacterized protein n=1 Tax=Limtongia smithiae TaxID=1125753 RepID=UPI0034CD93B6
MGPMMIARVRSAFLLLLTITFIVSFVIIFPDNATPVDAATVAAAAVEAEPELNFSYDSKHLSVYNSDGMLWPVLGTCKTSELVSDSTIILPSASTVSGSLASLRARFHLLRTRHFYNSNLLATQSTTKLKYLGFTRFEPDDSHEYQWCSMAWASTVTSRRFIQCAIGKRINPPKFVSPKGSCAGRPTLEADHGFANQRVFWSPYGEPLMISTTNSHTGCLGQYLIDARAAAPEIAKALPKSQPAVRFDKYIDLNDTFVDDDPFDRNTIMLFDDKNHGFLSYKTYPQDIRSIDNPGVNIAEHNNNVCLRDLVRDEYVPNGQLWQATSSLRLTLCKFPCEPTEHNTVLISILYAKYKDKAKGELAYRQYLIVMQPVAPFQIIARSRKLIYAGAEEPFTVGMSWDTHTRMSWSEHEKKLKKAAEAAVAELSLEQEVPMKVSNDKNAGEQKVSMMANEKSNSDQTEEEASSTPAAKSSTKKVSMKETSTKTDDKKTESKLSTKEADKTEASATTEGKQAISKPRTKAAVVKTLDKSSTKETEDRQASATTRDKPAHKLAKRAVFNKQASSASTVSTERSSPNKKTSTSTKSKSPRPPTPWIDLVDLKGEPSMPEYAYNNTLISDTYQGWIDDTLLILFSVESTFSGMLQVKAEDIVNCLVICPT